MDEDYKYFLTFDVGTKNLAYCLSRYDVKKNILAGLDIISWDILDISFKPLICKHIVNKRKICNKNSLFYILKEGILDDKKAHENENNFIGYCKDHANELKKNDKNKYKKLHRISKNNLYVNTFNAQMERLLVALEELYISKIDTIFHIENSKGLSVSNLDIYIENQPVFKNPIMKTISIGIFTFFTLKKMLKNKLIKSVNFISASDKTHLTFINSMGKFLNIELKKNVDFKIYSQRKDFAIDTTNKIISNLNCDLLNIVSSCNYFLSHKKDDLADTLIYIIVIILKKL
jgi:hypothetical protein